MNCIPFFEGAKVQKKSIQIGTISQKMYLFEDESILVEFLVYDQYSHCLHS
jgi:hypothetical protein